MRAGVVRPTPMLLKSISWGTMSNVACAPEPEMGTRLKGDLAEEIDNSTAPK